MLTLILFTVAASADTHFFNCVEYTSCAACTLTPDECVWSAEAKLCMNRTSTTAPLSIEEACSPEEVDSFWRKVYIYGGLSVAGIAICIYLLTRKSENKKRQQVHSQRHYVELYKIETVNDTVPVYKVPSAYN